MSVHTPIDFQSALRTQLLHIFMWSNQVVSVLGLLMTLIRFFLDTHAHGEN